MKQRATIFTILSMAMFLFSCTSEDDVLNNMGKGENTGIVAGDKMAYVSFNISGVQTKSEPVPVGEMKITSVLYFLLDGNKDASKIIGYSESEGEATGGKILSKVKDSLFLVAVANAFDAKTELKKQATFGALKQVKLNKSDLDSKIKVGEPVFVSFVGVGGTTSTPDHYTGTDAYPTTKTIEVVVNQVTSCVELASFKAVYGTGVSDEFKARVKQVELKSCRLIYANQNGFLKNVAPYSSLSYDPIAITGNVTIGDGGEEPNKTFLTFASDETGQNATALEVTYRVEGKEEKTSVFKIKKDGVKEPFGVEMGKKYQLKMTVTVMQDKADVSIAWDVCAWQTIDSSIEFN